MRWIVLLILGASMAGAPVRADEDVDLLIAYMLHELEAIQTRCAEETLVEHEGRRVVCGLYKGTFSSLRSDWSQIMRHSKIPIRFNTADPWTYRKGAYQARFTHGTDREFSVDFRPADRGLVFTYVQQEEDPYADSGGTSAGPLDLPGGEEPPRMAGFGGVSMPRVIEESRVEPLRSEQARTERVAGTVTLEIVVNKDGTVRRVMALRADPEGYGFAEAAVEAVRQWRFEPAMLQGEPVTATLNRTIEVKRDAPEPAGDDEDE